MSKWRIELENVGRGKVTRTLIVNANTLLDVEHRAVRECGKHLMSRDIGIEDNADLTYTVIAGLRSVGKVKIVSI